MTQTSGNRVPPAAPELVAAVMSRDLSLVSWLARAAPALSFRHIDPAVPSLGDEARQVSVKHREARELLHTLDTSLDKVMSPSFAADWRRLESMTKEHVQEEETEIFPLLRRNCSEEQLREMGEKVEASKKTAPTYPHPSTPDNPVGAKVMGAAAGVADRARDAVRK